MSRLRVHLLVVLIAILAIVDPVFAQDAKPARIPVKIVNGRLVVGCQLAARKRIAVNLFVDFEAPFGLLLHNKAAGGIESEAADGTPRPITIHLPDLNIEVPDRAHGDEAYYEHFTKWWSIDLGEQPVVGTIGSKVLSRFHAVLDLSDGFLELSPPRSTEDVARPANALPIALYNDQVWLPVSFRGRAGALLLATSRYDTRIESEMADELDGHDGDVGPVRLGEFDLAAYTPFRAEPLRQVHPDGVFGATGLGLLRHFRVTIDRSNRIVVLEPTAPPDFPVADAELWKARASQDPAAFEAWLSKYPTQRLAAEAADMLLDMRLDEGAGQEVMARALNFVQASRPKDLATTGALELMQKLLASGRASDAVAAGELGLAHGREDRYPDAVHHVHARMGSILLEQKAQKEAWRHLLSAAFGLPEDGPLNLDLARCYENDGRWSRAYSRYLQALLSAESGPAAALGLERVQPKLEDTESFGVTAIERRIEGKVEGFGAATTYDAGDPPTTRVALVEYFTNAHDEFVLGPSLARDGLRDHFGKYLIHLCWHVPQPMLDPMVNSASVANWRRIPDAELAQVLDGVAGLPPRGLTRFKQEIFDAGRKAIEVRLAEPSAHTIAIEASMDREGVRGTATVSGPDVGDLRVELLLVERGVLFPGKSKVVIHRNVVRAALTATADGVEFTPVASPDGSPTQSIAFERRYADVERENGEFLDAEAAANHGIVPRMAVRIDPREVRVVAILRASDGEVLQAALCDPQPVNGLEESFDGGVVR